ncbi:sugar-binding protein [Aquimarina sp. AD10]|uniref:sugar-binding protein n=1 Tax=Aquimarina sp. AD10 TaxID=1714849 RepID=UPI000E4A94DE|nr:sugar-binding protein [Aquimarina sp. AD10]AXT60205.1 sugar-binding protein [Aquimarina sp. AD10]RKM92989.1 sugar-binding protein [Aquimarina sp. AD10]
MKQILIAYILIIVLSCKTEKKNAIANTSTSIEPTTTTRISTKKDHQIREIKKATIVPKLDGIMDDPIWKEVKWYGLDQRWLGEEYTVDDFFGRYKMAWTPEAIYILVEIKDDKIYDQYKDPLTLWWDDDCVEIFIDADNSGGNHQFTNNAFAYHVALDGNVVDLGKDEKPLLYNNHITTKRVTKGDVTVWEFEMIVYDDSYEEGKVNDPVILSKDQKLGFAIAYNDNDGSKERENFIGSVFIPGEEKNLGWINADVFGTIVLKE